MLGWPRQTKTQEANFKEIKQPLFTMAMIVTDLVFQVWARVRETRAKEGAAECTNNCHGIHSRWHGAPLALFLHPNGSESNAGINWCHSHCTYLLWLHQGALHWQPPSAKCFSNSLHWSTCLCCCLCPGQSSPSCMRASTFNGSRAAYSGPSAAAAPGQIRFSFRKL